MTASQRIVRAIENQGTHPDYHREQIARLRLQWPAMAHALADLLREQGRPIPMEWRR